VGLVHGGKEKIMNINSANLKVGIAASTNELRRNIMGIHVTSGYTEATNGHIAARVTMPIQIEADDVPKQCPTLDKQHITPFIIPSSGVKSLKTFKVKRFPSLNDTLFIDVEKTNLNGQAYFTATDLEQTSAPVITKIEGEYPELDRVMPSDEPTYRVGFNVDYLITLCTIAKTMSTENNNAVTIEGFSHRKEVIQGLVNSIESLMRVVMEPAIEHDVDGILAGARVAMNRVDGDGCQTSKPWVMKAKNSDTGQEFTGLIMPVKL
jgi:DNA polymerase III sliding clamp (beta) subunit (PCNA family)